MSPSASKPEIRDAVESIWGVEVLKVNTLNRQNQLVEAGRVEVDGESTGVAELLESADGLLRRAAVLLAAEVSQLA